MNIRLTNLQGAEHFISLSTAIQMTTRYRYQKENILSSEYRDMGILPLCETFGRDALDGLLAQPSCVGLRIYGGMDENLNIRYVIVGVNALGQDILPVVEAGSSISSDINPSIGKIVEEGIRCPTFCPVLSVLNAGY